jgi:hypothetical protein
MAINNEQLELGMRNMDGNTIYKSTIVNMATVRNYGVMSGKFNADRIRA